MHQHFDPKQQSAWIIMLSGIFLHLPYSALSASSGLSIPYNSQRNNLDRARYAYWDLKGEDSDDAENESLCRETSKGSIGLIKQDKNEGDTSDVDEEEEEGKRE
ncbi:hypothetical protein BUALT_Bualt19G0092500 [Buddleja alternifolia]|uniref:Uncharacterized protein n=1 Tax=Buddleja alternifolia TaxID=168488 RepID=A0AAV6W233_9LAMI|nr:hypothetical protein BUALT_Bualt19G0092500 [Buddleja alternifolia]